MQICASCQLEQALLTGKRRGCHRSVLRHRLLLVVDVSMMVHMLPLPPAASWESSARYKEQLQLVTVPSSMHGARMLL